MPLEDLHPMFVGPYAENADVLEDLIVDFLRDHVYWRRNFHPESRPPIPTSAQYRDDYIDFLASMKQELFSLSADLKKSVPFFSPRYVGHMASDLLLPGLVANIITTLYNPNNVAEEAAPATLQKELEVGFQLAEMFGFETDVDRTPCAWGHLTSGGTVANYEGLRNITAVRHYPLALAAALDQVEATFGGLGPLDGPISEASPWELVNLSLDAVVELRTAVIDEARRRLDRADLQKLREAISAQRLEHKGLIDFYRTHDEVKPPLLLVPKTAHYSWKKSMKVLNLGTSQLLAIEVDENMRMDMGDLEETLEQCLDDQQPVLALVGVLGNTEFGTVDPIGEIVEMRDRFRQRGLDIPLHIDAAWGGYLASVFRRPDGRPVDRKRLQKEFHYFPSRTVYEAFTSLSEADSITVDPHKLGYIPYPAGAYVARNAKIVDFIGQKAAYVFDVEEDGEADRLDEKLRNLGQYILEGSKPGAAAASAHVTHNVLPLHTEGFGAILKETVRACEYFYDQIDEFAGRVDEAVEIAIPFEPDSNLVCLAVNPVGNDALAAMNDYGRRLFEEMKMDAAKPIQERAFIASYTSLLAEDYPASRAEQLLEPLGVDPSTFQRDPRNEASAADHIFLLRHTLMNPWLRFEEEGRNYIDLYFDHLEELIRRTPLG